MKKIGILTFPKSPSFGASLQMYALYKALSEMGQDVEVINYINSYMKAQKHITSSGITSRIKAKISDLANVHGHREFTRFESRLAFYPKQCVNRSDLKNLVSRYDYLICGSDQVWNPYITNNDMSYFFDFCDDNTKKISYAPSFGLSEIPEKYQDEFARELKKFYRISVREEVGKTIVRKLSNRDATLVVDPTLLIKKEEWQKHRKKVHSLPSHYIARFTFNCDEKTESCIQAIARETGLPIVTIGGNALSLFKKGLFTGPIGPEEWLYTISNADYVITDSFHGAVFSIIFEKNLYVSTASSTNSRLITLMNTFELDNRIIQNLQSQDLLSPVCYAKIRNTIQEKRIVSLQYLREAMDI